MIDIIHKCIYENIQLQQILLTQRKTKQLYDLKLLLLWSSRLFTQTLHLFILGNSQTLQLKFESNCYTLK